MKKKTDGIAHFMTGAVLALVLAACPAAAMEGPVEAQTEEPAEIQTEEPAEAQTEEPVEVQTEEPVEAQTKEPALERFTADPVSFILDEMSDECFTAFYEDEALVSFGEVPGEDICILSIQKGGEARIYGGPFTLEENHVVITDAFGGGQIAFDVGHDSGCPFIILLEDNETGEKTALEMWPAPASIPAAAVQQVLGDPKEAAGSSLEALCGRDPLFALLAGITQAWERIENEGTQVIYGLSGDGNFACEVSVLDGSRIRLKTGTPYTLPQTKGLWRDADPTLPGRLMLYTDDYLDYIISAEAPEESLMETGEEMTEEP